MEEFKKRLYKEWLELGYRTHQNALFIHHNPKFRGLGPHLQMAQLRQYFAQQEYLDALRYRVDNILLPDERREMETEIGHEFAEKFKGCTLYVTREKAEEIVKSITSASCGYVDDADGSPRYIGADRMYDLIHNDGHINYGGSTYHISRPLQCDQCDDGERSLTAEPEKRRSHCCPEAFMDGGVMETAPEKETQGEPQKEVPEEGHCQTHNA